MQPLRLIIPGEWWDSLLYKGRLHLFGRDGSLRIIDWDSLIENLVEGRSSQTAIALRNAFAESNMLYKRRFTVPQLARFFATVDQTDFHIGANTLKTFEIYLQDNKFPYPHATSAFHYDRLIIATGSGIYGAIFDGGLSRFDSPPVRISPVGANQAWPAYGSVALAAGENGLREFSLGPLDQGLPRETDAQTVSEKHCDACDWMYQSVFGYSLDGTSVLARYEARRASEIGRKIDADTRERLSDETAPLTDPIIRILKSVQDATELVANVRDPAGTKPLVWGSQDKIYKVEGDHIAVFRYIFGGKVTWIGNVKYAFPIESLVSVKTSLFGVVLEFDEGLTVLTSDGASTVLSGEPVNWRVFPRSRNYENHLHVIREDSLDILSFNQDYAVDQFRKLVGTRVPRGWTADETP